MEEQLTKYMKAFKLLKVLEYNNSPEKFLHKNRNESHATIGGVYLKFWEKEVNADFIYNTLEICDNDYKRASTMLYYDSITRAKVASFFKIFFWDKCRLDEVQSQKICNEIFLFAVHVGVKNAVKTAQKQVGVSQDGIIGKITIKALNNFNENRFDVEFDTLELEYYKGLEVFNKYPNGFTNRSVAV